MPCRPGNLKSANVPSTNKPSRAKVHLTLSSRSSLFGIAIHLARCACKRFPGSGNLLHAECLQIMGEHDGRRYMSTRVCKLEKDPCDYARLASRRSRFRRESGTSVFRLADHLMNSILYYTPLRYITSYCIRRVPECATRYCYVTWGTSFSRAVYVRPELSAYQHFSLMSLTMGHPVLQELPQMIDVMNGESTCNISIFDDQLLGSFEFVVTADFARDSSRLRGRCVNGILGNNLHILPVA